MSIFPMEIYNQTFSVSTGEAVKIVSDGRNITSISSIKKVPSNKVSAISGNIITVGGKEYTMSENVQIYIKKSYEYTMITMDELSQNYENYNLSAYIDKEISEGGRVRIIVLS